MRAAEDRPTGDGPHELRLVLASLWKMHRLKRPESTDRGHVCQEHLNGGQTDVRTRLGGATCALPDAPSEPPQLFTALSPEAITSRGE